MIGRRKKPDGLPFRLYMYEGKRTVSFFYKNGDGTIAFRYSAPRVRPEKVADVRRRAIEEANKLNGELPATNNTTWLIDKYFEWQENMSPLDERRKSAATLKENKRERNWLDKFFGEMAPAAIRPMHIYEYLDGRARLGAPAKANKEISLLSRALEYGRRIGQLETNPCADLDYNPTRPRTTVVAQANIDFALKIARQRGGQFLVMGLCAKAAYHAVGRPDEMRKLVRSAITDAGVEIPIGKRKAGHAQRFKLAEWNDPLRAAIDEALSLQKTSSIYVFASARGGAYNRNTWSNNWRKLMAYCEKTAAQSNTPFQRFTLADMRPTSVTKRMDEGDERITDATGHTDMRTVNKVYDRRRVKRFKATD